MHNQKICFLKIKKELNSMEICIVGPRRAPCRRNSVLAHRETAVCAPHCCALASFTGRKSSRLQATEVGCFSKDTNILQSQIEPIKHYTSSRSVQPLNLTVLTEWRGKVCGLTDLLFVNVVDIV